MIAIVGPKAASRIVPLPLANVRTVGRAPLATARPTQKWRRGLMEFVFVQPEERLPGLEPSVKVQWINAELMEA